MSIKYKGQTVADVGGGATSSSPSLDVYSTEETRIGTWVDGKPLYRKTFINVGTQKNTLSQYYVPGTKKDDLNVDKMVKVQYGVENDIFVNKAFPYPLIGNSGIAVLSPSWSSVLGAFLDNINENNQHISVQIENLYLVLEYTKTTDEPEVVS